MGYPDHPIRVVVPYGPGGGTDILARRIGAAMAVRLGQPVIILNKPGAATEIGTGYVAQAAPDGYTLLFGTSTHPVLPALNPHLSFDVIKDFAPITLFCTSASIFLVHPSVPANTLKEFLAYARSHQPPLSYSSSGFGGTGQLGMELLKQMTDLPATHIPYTGGAPALASLIAGQVQFNINDIAAAVPMVKAGKVRALAVTTSTRVAALPDVPTVAEAADLPGYEITAWFGVLAPAGTPAPIIARLNSVINEIVHTPEIEKALAEQGDEVAGTTPEAFAKTIRDGVKRWHDVFETQQIQTPLR